MKTIFGRRAFSAWHVPFATEKMVNADKAKISFNIVFILKANSVGSGHHDNLFSGQLDLKLIWHETNPRLDTPEKLHYFDQR